MSARALAVHCSSIPVSTNHSNGLIRASGTKCSVLTVCRGERGRLKAGHTRQSPASNGYVLGAARRSCSAIAKSLSEQHDGDARANAHEAPPPAVAGEPTAAALPTGWGSTILQQQLPPEHSLQQLLQPLLPQPTTAPGGSTMPGDDVATIAAASTSLATVGSSSSTVSGSPSGSSAASSAFSNSNTEEAVAEPIDVQAIEPPPRASSPMLTLAVPAAATTPAAVPAAAPVTAKKNRDWVNVVGVCAFAAMLCYLDRTNISTAIVPMAEQFGWNKQFCGAVLSAFFAGYGATQVLGGQWSDKYGGSAVLAGGLALWSVATALTPFAAARGTMPLLAARTLLGMGQGVAFPAMHALLAKHVPHKVRSGAIGIIMACAHCGTALGFGASPAIIDAMGWGWTYYLFGGAALLWLPFWLNMGKKKAQAAARAAAAAAALQAQQLQQRAAAASAHIMHSGGSAWSQAASMATAGGAAALCSSATVQDAVMPAVRDTPAGTSRSAHPLLDAIEQQHDQQQQQALLQQRAAAAATSSSSKGSSKGDSSSSNLNVGFWPLMRRKEVWAIAVAQYTAGWGFYGLLAWLPSFFIEHCGLQLSQLGGFTLAPYLLQAVVGASAGILADNLIVQRNWGIRDVRVLMQVAGMLGPAACLFAAASPLSAHSPYLATGLITVAMGMSALTCSGVSASHLDIAPRHAGVVFGVGNTAGTLAGLVAVPGLGYVLQQTGNWSIAFGLAAAHNVVGAALWAKWVGDKPLPEDGGEPDYSTVASPAGEMKLKAA